MVNDVDLLIKTVLEKIENNGFEAYIVGGFVRDLYLGRESTDVDIITNALPKDLHLIFDSGIVSTEAYGSFRLKSDKFTFDITTYRSEAKYHNRRPGKVKYINNLIEDLHRRDFTINSLCMDKFGSIIDLLNATSDIENKKIRVIGKTKTKLKEDPLRILRALRFAVVLDFSLDEEIIKFIKKNKKLIKTLSYDRKKEELNKILVSSNACKGLKYMKILGVLDELEIDFDDLVFVNDLSGMWSQLRVSSNYNFTKQEKSNIKTIKEIVSYGKITNEIVYKYGLYYVVVAGSILGVNNVTINKMYNDLPIKNVKDINITAKEIIELLNIKPSELIKNIYSDLETNILNGNLKNNKEEIIEYIKGKW